MRLPKWTGAQVRKNLALSIPMRPSRTASRLNHWDARHDAESTGQLRLAFAGEGLFLKEGPMQPSFTRHLLLCGSIMVLSGEAESGSAGTQPDKE